MRGLFEHHELALLCLGDLVFIGSDHAWIGCFDDPIHQLADLPLAGFRFALEPLSNLFSAGKPLVPAVGQYGSRHLHQ
nr:hypothetical protein [uncultured Hyphomonas sp.]